MPPKSPAKAAATGKDMLIKGPTGPSWDAIRALAAGTKADLAAASSQAKSFLSNPALPALTGVPAAAIAKLSTKAASSSAAAFKEVLSLCDAAVAKLTAGGAPPAPASASKAKGKQPLDVAAMVAELCVGVGAAFAPDALKALEKAAIAEAGGKPAKKAAKKVKKAKG